MKQIYTVVLLVIISFSIISAQEGVKLLSNFNPYPNAGYSDIWGYAAEGREYALLCVNLGTSIVDITDPENPYEVEFIAGPSSAWRDIKVHSTYAYVVTEGTTGNNGLQIIDLSDLPNSATLVKATTNFFGAAHNIFIDDGYAYVIGTNDGGGMHILDLSNPENPVETAYYTDSDYIHDVYVWGDTVVACAADTYDLIDVTDKENPSLISSSVALPGVYAHSGWMTEDKRFFFGTEEGNVRDIMIWDLKDKKNWKLVVDEFNFSQDSPVHNLFIKGNYAHISYYNEGYVALDITNPTQPIPVAQYDTYSQTGGGYNGAWGCYPFLPSGNVLISDMSTGLYVLSFNPIDNPPPFLLPQLVGDYTEANTPINVDLKIYENGTIEEAFMYYRSTHNGSTSDWKSLTDVNGPDDNAIYSFSIPKQSDKTKIDYYFAAKDDGDKIKTSPSGGSGSPAGTIPPDSFYSFNVINISDPVIVSLSYTFEDTTITTEENLHFSVEATDNSGLELTYSWIVNGQPKGKADNYSYRSLLGDVPRTDTLLLVISNDLRSVEKQWIINVVEVPTSVDDDLQLNFSLAQNYPNPFNPSTQINYSLPEATNVKLKVFNSLGEEVVTLVNDYQVKGRYEVEFNAKELSSGFYIAQIIAGKFTKNIKMLLIK